MENWFVHPYIVDPIMTLEMDQESGLIIWIPLKEQSIISKIILKMILSKKYSIHHLKAIPHLAFIGLAQLFIWLSHLVKSQYFLQRICRRYYAYGKTLWFFTSRKRYSHQIRRYFWLGAYSLEGLTDDFYVRKKPMKELFGKRKMKRDGTEGKTIVLPSTLVCFDIQTIGHLSRNYNDYPSIVPHGLNIVHLMLKEHGLFEKN